MARAFSNTILVYTFICYVCHMYVSNFPVSCVPQDTLNTIQTVQRQHSITSTSLLNFVVSDGNNLIGTRFVLPEHEKAATLYYAEAAAFEREESNSTSGASSSYVICLYGYIISCVNLAVVPLKESEADCDQWYASTFFQQTCAHIFIS